MKNAIKTVLLVSVIIAVTACNKNKGDQSAQLAELTAKMEAMQAEFDKAKSANSAPEEIARLEATEQEQLWEDAQRQTEIAQTAEQQEGKTSGNTSSSSAQTMPTATTPAASTTTTTLTVSQPVATTPAASNTSAAQRPNSTTNRQESIATLAVTRQEASQAAAAAERARIEQETGMSYEEYSKRLKAEQEEAMRVQEAKRLAEASKRLTQAEKDALVAKGQAVLTVDRVTARPGEQATVIFYLVHPGLAAFHLRVRYDATRLRIDSPGAVTRGNGALLVGYSGVDQDTYKNNPFSVIWYNGSNTRSVGELLLVRFTVLPNAPDGEAAVTAIVVGSANSQLKDIPVTIEQGCVTVVR